MWDIYSSLDGHSVSSWCYASTLCLLRMIVTVTAPIPNALHHRRRFSVSTQGYSKIKICRRLENSHEWGQRLLLLCHFIIKTKKKYQFWWHQCIDAQKGCHLLAKGGMKGKTVPCVVTRSIIYSMLSLSTREIYAQPIDQVFRLFLWFSRRFKVSN